MIPSRKLLASVALVALLAGCGDKDGDLSEKDRGLMAMAHSLRDGGHLKEAANVYSQMAASSSGSVDAHLELASIYRKMNQVPDAITTLEKARILQPRNVRVINALGNAHIAAKQPESAIHIFDEGIRIDESNAASYNGKGIALDNLERHDQAQAQYRKALALKPTNAADITNNLAMSLILSSHFDEAVDLLEPLMDQPTTSKTMRQNLALAYGLKGNSQKALDMNLKDLKPEQAKENMRFYEHYRKQLKPAVPRSKKKETVVPEEVNAEAVDSKAVFIEEKENALKAEPAAKVEAEEKPASKAAKAKTVYSAKQKKVVTTDELENTPPAPTPAPAPSIPSLSAPQTLNTQRPEVNTSYPSGR